MQGALVDDGRLRAALGACAHAPRPIRDDRGAAPGPGMDSGGRRGRDAAWNYWSQGGFPSNVRWCTSKRTAASTPSAWAAHPVRPGQERAGFEALLAQPSGLFGVGGQ